MGRCVGGAARRHSFGTYAPGAACIPGRPEQHHCLAARNCLRTKSGFLQFLRADEPTHIDELVERLVAAAFFVADFRRLVRIGVERQDPHLAGKVLRQSDLGQRHVQPAELWRWLFRFRIFPAHRASVVSVFSELHTCSKASSDEVPLSKGLVIVESPAKAKTIQKYLGAGLRGGSLARTH